MSERVRALAPPSAVPYRRRRPGVARTASASETGDPLQDVARLLCPFQQRLPGIGATRLLAQGGMHTR